MFLSMVGVVVGEEDIGTVSDCKVMSMFLDVQRPNLITG